MTHLTLPNAAVRCLSASVHNLDFAAVRHAMTWGIEVIAEGVDVCRMTLARFEIFEGTIEWIGADT
jgi:hypothetical protein